MRCVILACWLALGLAAAACSDGEPAEVLECTGSCSCDPDTRTCTCQGGSECAVEGQDDITLVCEGNARCELACGLRCRVECPGTAGCQAELGDQSTAVCNGTGDCRFTCAGDCAADCPGTSRCLLLCPAGADCEITSCPPAVLQDCGDGVLACRTACPD